MTENYVNYILACVTILIFTVACVVTFRHKGGDRVSKVFLSCMYWVYFYALTSVFIFDQGWVDFFPHLFRTVQIAALVYPPLSFLYVSHTLQPRPLKYLDLLHLLPVVLFIGDYMPFFMLPATEKISVFYKLQEDRSFFLYQEGLLMPIGGHILIRYLVMFGYWIAQSRLVYRLSVSYSYCLPGDQKMLVRWLTWLTASQLIIMLPPLLNFSFEVFPVGLINGICTMVAAIGQAYFLLFHPEILYGYFGEMPGSNETVTNELSAKKLSVIRSNDKSAQTNDPEGKIWMSELASRLELFFEQEEPFLQKGYGLPDLAKDIGCTTNQVSYLINNYYGIHFNRLINKYRVEVVKRKIVNGEGMHKTLEAIANESGFTSRATFINAFKSETGTTPSAYIRGINNNPV